MDAEARQHTERVFHFLMDADARRAEWETWKEQLVCVQSDPCAYDHTCDNHTLLWRIRQAMAQAVVEHHCACCEGDPNRGR